MSQSNLIIASGQGFINKDITGKITSCYIDYAEILSFLIKKAGTEITNFSSDLFNDWDYYISSPCKNLKLKSCEYELIFRENGFAMIDIKDEFRRESYKNSFRSEILDVLRLKLSIKTAGEIEIILMEEN